MTEDQVKLKLFALLADKDKDSSIDSEMRALARETKIPYPKLRRWQKEFDEGITATNIDTIVNAPSALVAEVAKQVAERSVEDTFEALPQDFVAKQDPEELEAYKDGKVEEFTKKVTDITVLSQDVLDEASSLVNLIAAKIKHMQKPLDDGGEPLDYVDTKSLSNLTSSLCSIQQAFFNKPQFSVAVKNKDGSGMMAMFSSKP